MIARGPGSGVILSASPGTNTVAFTPSPDPAGFDQVASFTTSGTFTIAEGDPSVTTANYLVVGGGGGSGGGGANSRGGGGAGGYRSSGFGPSPLQGNALFLSPGPYTVTVGAGGAASCSVPVGNGSNSVFSSITSAGGGHGASHRSAAQDGGSGGGGALETVQQVQETHRQ